MKLNQLLIESPFENPFDKSFDQNEIRSRLHTDRVKADQDYDNKDAVSFGMEDEDGNIVKVYVPYDQADDFEHALEMLLYDKLENNDYSISDDEKTITTNEISEIIFELKNNFDILDVQFPKIVGDEEAEEDVTDDLGDDELGDDELGDDEFGDDTLDNEEPDVQSTLDKLIDAMKADADAKKADAEAREAEANSKTAEIAAREAEMKIKQQEEVLDMESYNKKQADMKKEADLIAKLAKYRHEVDNNGDMS